MSVQYLDLDVNFESCTSLRAKITKIDTIIDALLVTALKSVNAGNRVEYMVDDGQSKQRVVYSTTESVTNAIKQYENIRQMYVNKLRGGVYRNVDQRNLKFRGDGC
jgi:hypothetical protein